MALASSADFKAPPSTRSTKAASTKKTTEVTASTGRVNARENAANGIFQLAGFGCIIAKQYADAGAISKHGGKIAHEAALLAETNEGMARALDYLMEAGPYAGLITACMPLVMQLAANHNLIKAEFVAGAGVESPDALAAQVRAEMAEEAMRALKAEQEARQRLATLETEMQTDSEASDSPNGVPAQ